jgi:malonate transporter MadL subunit
MHQSTEGCRVLSEGFEYLTAEEDHMVIYGVAIVAFCFFLGNFTGDVLGRIAGLNSNIGGVGFAMLFLLIAAEYGRPFLERNPSAIEGIRFWQAMFIPVVVAMSASQNVVRALSSGHVAIIAGLAATMVSFLFIPLFSRIGGEETPGGRLPKECEKP